MDFYNIHFYRLIRHVDPCGMLNVPFNVYTDETCLNKYFKTDKDFRQLDVPLMCDQLILLLRNFDEVYFDISCDLQFLQNDFQRKKCPFVLFTQAFIGLVLIQKNSVKSYFSYYRKSTMVMYKNKNALEKVPRKKKKKKPAANNQSLYEEIIPKQQIVISINQDQVISGLETNLNEIDVLLNHPKLSENAREINLPEINQIVSNIPIPHDQNTISNLNSEENVDIINRRSYSEQLQFIPLPSIEAFPISNQNILLENTPLQLQNKINSQDEQIQARLIEKSMGTPNLLEQPNEMAVEKENSLTNLLLKRKRASKIVKRNFKKRPIEQSSNIFKNRMKKLEGTLRDRPLECIAMKYTQQTMNHLPLRYAMYSKKLNISFAALTLNVELEKNKNLDEVFNNEITMSSYKAIAERFNNSNVSNNCIYQQCINNSLPHLSLLPLAEECLINNSLVWRDTINEINKKLGDSLKDISFISKVDHNKWHEFKEKMKQRVSQCIVPHKTLIGPELSNLNVSQPLMEFPSLNQINQLLNDKTVTEQQNPNEIPQLNNDNMFYVPLDNEAILPQLLPIEKSPFNDIQINITHKNSAMDQFEQNNQNNVKSVEVYHKQSIDILQIISNTLQQFPKKKSHLMFTDLCPIHVTNRKYAILVLVELLGMHKKGIVKLHQPLNTTEPSLISIDLNIEHFFE